MFAFISKELVQTSAKHHHLFYDNRSIAAVIGFLQAPGARRPRSSVQNSCPVSTGRRCAFSPSTRPNQACSTAMGRYPWAEVLLFHVIHITSYYPTHQRAYRVVALSAMIYVARQIYLTPEIAGPKVAYPMGCALACNFVFSVYLLSAEGPFPDYWRRVRDEVDTEVDAGGLDKLPSNFPLAKKLWWMVDIAYGVRMIGWVQEPRDCIPRHPPPSRRMFLWKTFLKLVMNIVTADLMNSALALSPAFDYRVHDPTDGPETYLAAVPLLRRVPYVLAWSIGTGASAGAIHNVVALVCVGLGYSSPTLWPDLWGRWRDAYTVRNLWGKTWHQKLRPMVGGLGRLIANKFLKFPRGTNRSSYAQLYIAFFLSGLIHSSGDFTVEKRMVYRSFKFFLLQAVVVTFEDFVIYIAKRSLRRGRSEPKLEKTNELWEGAVVRIIGYCWVTLWASLTFPVFLDGLNATGWGSVDRGPITQFLLNKRN